jgi:hypothetical protein
MEHHLDHDAPDDVVALRYHGDPAVSGQLDPTNGSMIWTTEGDPDVEPSGEFAVVDGVVVMHYDHDDSSWLRLGHRLVRWQDAGLWMEEGLSAQELVVELEGETIRLRADGDPVAVSFANRLAAASAAA